MKKSTKIALACFFLCLAIRPAAFSETEWVFSLKTFASDSVYGPFENVPGTIFSIYGRTWSIMPSRSGQIIFCSHPEHTRFGPYDFVENRIVRLGDTAYTIVNIMRKTEANVRDTAAAAQSEPSGASDTARKYSDSVPTRWIPGPPPNTNPEAANIPEVSFSLDMNPFPNRVSLWAGALDKTRHDWSIGGFRGNKNSSLSHKRVGISGNYGNWFGEVSYAFSGKSMKNLVPDGSVLSDLGLDDGKGFQIAGGYMARFNIDGAWNVSAGGMFSFFSEDYNLSARSFTRIDANDEPDPIEVGETEAVEEQSPDYSLGYVDSSASFSINETVLYAVGGIDYARKHWGAGAFIRLTAFSDTNVDGNIAVENNVFDLSAELSHPVSIMMSGWYAPNDWLFLNGLVSFGADTMLRIGIGSFF